jgi:hypothetical protein
LLILGYWLLDSSNHVYQQSEIVFPLNQIQQTRMLYFFSEFKKVNFVCSYFQPNSVCRSRQTEATSDCETIELSMHVANLPENLPSLNNRNRFCLNTYSFLLSFFFLTASYEQKVKQLNCRPLWLNAVSINVCVHCCFSSFPTYSEFPDALFEHFVSLDSTKVTLIDGVIE